MVDETPEQPDCDQWLSCVGAAKILPWDARTISIKCRRGDFPRGLVRKIHGTWAIHRGRLLAWVAEQPEPAR